MITHILFVLLSQLSLSLCFNALQLLRICQFHHLTTFFQNSVWPLRVFRVRISLSAPMAKRKRTSRSASDAASSGSHSSKISEGKKSMGSVRTAASGKNHYVARKVRTCKMCKLESSSPNPFKNLCMYANEPCLPRAKGTCFNPKRNT